MNFVFLMDPPERLKIETDTSYLFMRCASNRGHNIFYLVDGGIILKNSNINFLVKEVKVKKDLKKPFVEKRTLTLKQEDTDIVFIRTDPPFDEQYLINSWLIDRLPKNIPVINSASGIRTVNEKIWATQFSRIIPPTLIARHKSELIAFLKREKDTIVKPTGGFGGFSIFRVSVSDVNAIGILESMTEKWTKEIILQKYIPAAVKGDKRILLLNGKILGAIRRTHALNDHRNNISSGGKAFKCKLTYRDKEIIDTLAPKLNDLGIYFAGIDIIGSYLIEVNVTSPTCIVEMNELYKKELENYVIDFAEKLVKNFKKIRR